METIGIIAGRGIYPATFIDSANRQPTKPRLVIAGFHGETDPELEEEVAAMAWFRVGQLGKLIKFFKKQGVSKAIMVGQITPSNLYQLRPDLRTFILLAKLKQRNAETMFSAIADELQKDGIDLLPATTFLDHLLPGEGIVCGPKRKESALEEASYAFSIAKKSSELDIGQCAIVRKGTILAVEAFEGTNDCIKRAGELGRHRFLTMAKVSKPNQDFRFDVPVIGPDTIRNAADAGVQTIAIEADCTLLLGKREIVALCEEHKICLLAMKL